MLFYCILTLEEEEEEEEEEEVPDDDEEASSPDTKKGISYKTVKTRDATSFWPVIASLLSGIQLDIGFDRKDILLDTVKRDFPAG
jgi:hypothetical protein